MHKCFWVLLLVFSFIYRPSESLGQSLSIQVKDKYLLGKGIVAHNKSVIQTDLYIPLDKGLYLDFWWSSGFNKKLDGGFDDEIDETIGWSGEVKNLDVDLGIAHFNLFRIDRLDGDVVQPYFEIGKNFKVNDRHALTPYFRTEIYFPVGWKGVDAKRGAHIFGGIKHYWQALERLTISQKLAAVYDTGTFVNFDHGFLGDYSVGLGWKITDKITIDLPTFRAVFPLTDLKDGRKPNTVFGGGITFKF